MVILSSIYITKSTYRIYKILRDKSLILNWIMKYLKIIHKDLISPWSIRRGMVLVQNSQPDENLYKKIPKFNV